MVVYFAVVWVEISETVKANFRKWHSTWYLMFMKRAHPANTYSLLAVGAERECYRGWVWRRKPSILCAAVLLPQMFGHGDVMTAQHQGVGGPHPY